MPLTAVTKSVQDTHALAASIARQCQSGDCILLRGDLGSGKTEFARGFIHAAQDKEEDVVSPTFTLAQRYPARDGKVVWHFDLYRLESSEEVLETGMEEALQSGVTLIEWPEVAENMLPPAALDVRITYGKQPDERQFVFSGQAWEKRLKTIEKDIRV